MVAAAVATRERGRRVTSGWGEKKRVGKEGRKEGRGLTFQNNARFLPAAVEGADAAPLARSDVSKKCSLCR